MKLRQFPFDSQQLRMYFRPFVWDRKDVVLVPDEWLSGSWERDVGIDQWDLNNVTLQENPLEVLQKVGEVGRISSTAKRGLIERSVERDFAARWPEVEEPRVCLAFPTGAIADPDDSEPISMVMAKGLDVGEIETARRFIADRVEGLPWKNVLIMGTVHRSHANGQREDGRFLLTKSETR